MGTCAATPSNLRRFLVNGSEVRLASHQARPTWQRRLAVALLVALVAITVPRLAFGWPWDDWVKGTIQDAVNILNNDITIDSLKAEYGHLLSPGAKPVDPLWSTVYDIAFASKGIVKSIATTLLALIILMQLYKISQRMDTNSQMPGLKEVLQLFCFCAIWMYLVNHAFDIVSGMVDLSNVISDKISVSGHDALSIDQFADENLIFNLANCVVAIILHVGALISSLSIQVLGFMRGVQIYFYAMFSPIAFCFLGFDDIRQWGIGYFKGFLAVCLSGTVLIFIVSSYPAILNSMAASAGDGKVDLIYTLAVVYSYNLLVMKSGSLARDILGG